MNKQATGRPYFLPEDLDYQGLPAAVRAAITDLLVPAYEQLVVGAVDPLERSAGSSFVFLLLIELLEQFELGREAGRALETGGALSREEELARHLRLIRAKEKAGSFLLRVRTCRARQGAVPLVSPAVWRESHVGQPASC